MKKTTGIIIGILVIATLCVLFFTLNNKKSDNQNNDTVKEEQIDNKKISSKRKTIVIYYSAQKHTKKVAEYMAKSLNADTFEIEVANKYKDADLNWRDENSRVVKEYKDKSLRNQKLSNSKVPNWEKYDTVFIGYPIWWGIAAWPTNSFVKENDFKGKTVIPFATSTSSGFGESGKLLKEDAKGGEWRDGHRFGENPSNSDIDRWLKSLGL